MAKEIKEAKKTEVVKSIAEVDAELLAKSSCSKNRKGNTKYSHPRLPGKAK